MAQEINLKELDMPVKKKKGNDLRWVCNSLGLIKGRDTESTSFKIMQGLLKKSKLKPIISAEEISTLLKIEQPCVNHHLRTFVESGILVREKRKVMLRGGTLTSAIEEMQRDSEKMFKRILKISKEIDTRFFSDFSRK